uniref:Uncharacterized protein n=1 Tax=Manihot esculenta TaxID=3983 RepID=A0A2C9U1Z2_MANES
MMENEKLIEWLLGRPLRAFCHLYLYQHCCDLSVCLSLFFLSFFTRVDVVIRHQWKLGATSMNYSSFDI